MPCSIKNPSNIDLVDLEPHVQGMYDYFEQKIGFNRPPTMVFDSDPNNEANVLGKTAYYDPNTLQIHVYTDGRHPKDMLRSIAHELIHHWQNEEGRLDVGGYSGPGYYLKNKDLNKLEKEAMNLSAQFLREYEDKKKLEENKKMSIKEWKNNELNRRLMKKFGILNETNMYKRDDELEEAADKNDGLESPDGEDTSFGHIKEDSGEEEGRHYDKNRMSDDDHIKAIEHHLEALKKDRNYDDDHEEERQDEHRKHKDKLVGHEDRGQNDRVQQLQEEGDAIEDDLLDDKDAAESTKEDSVGVSESLKENIKKILKKNKKLRLRIK